MSRITIKTNAYAHNRHYLEITDALCRDGYTCTPNVATDGEVSIDTNAPQDICRNLTKGRPQSVKFIH